MSEHDLSLFGDVFADVLRAAITILLTICVGYLAKLSGAIKTLAEKLAGIQLEVVKWTAVLNSVQSVVADQGHRIGELERDVRAMPRRATDRRDDERP